jgi:hypothetical protein
VPRPRRRLGPAQALLQKLRCHNIVMHAPADAAPHFTRGVFLGKRNALPSMSNGVATLPAAVCTAVISIIDEALFSMESSAGRGSAKEVLMAREIQYNLISSGCALCARACVKHCFMAPN